MSWRKVSRRADQRSKYRSRQGRSKIDTDRMARLDGALPVRVTKVPVAELETFLDHRFGT